MFTHHADAFLKPDIFPSAAAEMVRKNMNGVPILRWQERGYALAGRLDAPRNIAVSPLSACLQWETEIGRDGAIRQILQVCRAKPLPLAVRAAADHVDAS